MAGFLTAAASGRKAKASALARFALDFDVAAVLADDSVADRKPQAGTLARAFSGEERIENARQILGSDARARIGAPSARTRLSSRGAADGQRAARFHRVAGV